MTVFIVDIIGLSNPFPFQNGTKQGYVLAPLLLNVFYSAMLLDAFCNCNLGVNIQYHTDGSIFSLCRLNSTSKVMELLARDLLYADDCALAAHSVEDAQAITDCFAHAAAFFGLTVSIKKTEVIKQARPGGLVSSGSITINGAPLKVVDSYCYLGSMLSSDALRLRNDLYCVEWGVKLY